MHYPEVEYALKETCPDYSVPIPHGIKVNWPCANLPPLRVDQESALQAWIKTRRGVLVMPTGTGKTEVALHIMHRLPVFTLVVSPVRDLMYQWHQRIQERLGYNAGIIGDNTFNKQPVSVTTYDSACIHMQNFGAEFELLIFDECHHLPGQVRSDAARMSVAPYRLGLTATPERSDGREAALDSRPFRLQTAPALAPGRSGFAATSSSPISSRPCTSWTSAPTRSTPPRSRSSSP